MSFGYTQVGQHQRHWLRSHRGSAIGVDGQSACRDALSFAGCRDQPFGQLGGLAPGDHPAHHVAAEDVEDDVQVEIGPLGWTQQLRYIPAPDLIGPCGQQFRLLVLRMTELVALCANMSETSRPSTITVGRGKKSHFDEHKQDKQFFRCVGSFGA